MRIGLPLLYVLWANIHIQFVMGFALLGLAWLVSLVAISLLFVTLCKLELTSKSARDHLRRLRRRLEAREEAGAERVFVGAP